jgi:hypothetical protein
LISREINCTKVGGSKGKGKEPSRGGPPVDPDTRTQPTNGGGDGKGFIGDPPPIFDRDRNKSQAFL